MNKTAAFGQHRAGPSMLFATLLLASTGLAAAATLTDRLPASDPAIEQRTFQPPIIAPRPAPSDPSVIVSAATSVFNAAAWTVSGLINLPSATGTFLWETSYMLGLNTTPVRRAPLNEPLPDPEAEAAERQAAERARLAANRVEPAKAEPAAARPAPPPMPVVTMPIGPVKEIDQGLLTNFVYDRSARREDGTFFVPKPLQRLFNVRTQQARIADVPTTVRIVGRIIPDPAMRGTVQPSVPGRLEPPEGGFPVLGDTVQAGQIIGWVSPSVGVVDRTQARRDVARLTTEIRVETEALEILRQFSFVPFREGKIYQAEQRIAGLRQQRDALLPMLKLREELRAPSTGVVSASGAINGKIVQAGEVVFEVIDPNRMWIEATAPDPVTAAQASKVASANAVTPEGTNLAIAFVGSGLALEQQATPILFRIENPPPGLRVGRPVTVSVQSAADMRRGIPVNRASVTTGSSGVEEVWEQTAPEVFVPHPVRTQNIDGATILVVDGVTDGARIVVNGARLMAQLQ